MIHTLSALAASVILTASAAPPELEKAFHGTIVSTYPDGRQAELWMNPDGTYTSEGRRHERHNGKWSVKGDKVCFRRGIFGYCTAMPSETEFTTKAVTGETIKVRLKPGREGEKQG